MIVLMPSTVQSALSDALEDYNDTVHSTTGFRPNAFFFDYTAEKYIAAKAKADAAWKTITPTLLVDSTMSLRKGHYQISDKMNKGTGFTT